MLINQSALRNLPSYSLFGGSQKFPKTEFGEQPFFHISITAITKSHQDEISMKNVLQGAVFITAAL